MNLKIGILIEDYKDLSNWKLRAIQAILNDPKLELTAVIEETHDKESDKGNSAESFFSKFGLTEIVLRLQKSIEKNIFFKEIRTVDRPLLSLTLDKLPRIVIAQKSEVLDHELHAANKEKIEKQNFDLIINLGHPDSASKFIKCTEYPIWDFSLSDFPLDATMPEGFSEVLQKQSSIGFTLLKRTASSQIEIIDKAFFNRSWSMVEMATISGEGGVSVLLKNLRNLQVGHKFDSQAQAYPKYKTPTLLQVLKYIVQFYSHLWSKIWQKIAYRFWGQRHECWAVFIGKDNFLNSSLSDCRPLEMPKDEFWADPFLFKYKETDYVFFENFSFNLEEIKAIVSSSATVSLFKSPFENKNSSFKSPST